MRRGSKCPTMLKIPLSLHYERFVGFAQDSQSKSCYQARKVQHHLSMVTALRLKMEKSAMMGPKAAPLHTFPVSRKRSLALELLSKVEFENTP